MTEIMPDFSAYCKQDNVPSYNDLDENHTIKLPTRIREEPENVMVGLDCPMLRTNGNHGFSWK
jgi:hypothetical protein